MADKPQNRRRLPRSEREQMIVDEAVRFFAEVGFEGQTRALAQRLGVTQPLLYRYFPDKEALIERVYQEVFIGGWDPAWSILLCDRSVPIELRIRDFYHRYTKANFNFERVRLFLFAGLKDQRIAQRYLAFIHEQLFVPVAREIRATAGLPDTDPSPAEIECVAGLHGAVGYLGMRRWVFNAPVAEDMEAAASAIIAAFTTGAAATFRSLAV